MKNMMLKLHPQFAHPSAYKLKELLDAAGKLDSRMPATVDSISEGCKICIKFKKPRPQPIVCMPLANHFNEVVAMDLEIWHILW